ncbi:hypothetical protein Tco_0686135 [Tanacetum coccineum]
MVAYLQKSEGSERFHQIIDFLNTSHIQYALTENPTIYVSFIKQFWSTATAGTKEGVPMPYESPLHSVHLLGRDKGSVSLNELTVLCTSLSKKVRDLENELQQTKTTYSIAITKLILRVKKLEQKVKTTKSRRKARIVLSNDEEDLEDPSK